MIALRLVDSADVARRARDAEVPDDYVQAASSKWMNSEGVQTLHHEFSSRLVIGAQRPGGGSLQHHEAVLPGRPMAVSGEPRDTQSHSQQERPPRMVDAASANIPRPRNYILRADSETTLTSTVNQSQPRSTQSNHVSGRSALSPVLSHVNEGETPVFAQTSLYSQLEQLQQQAEHVVTDSASNWIQPRRPVPLINSNASSGGNTLARVWSRDKVPLEQEPRKPTTGAESGSESDSETLRHPRAVAAATELLSWKAGRSHEYTRAGLPSPEPGKAVVTQRTAGHPSSRAYIMPNTQHLASSPTDTSRNFTDHALSHRPHIQQSYREYPSSQGTGYAGPSK